MHCAHGHRIYRSIIFYRYHYVTTTVMARLSSPNSHVHVVFGLALAIAIAVAADDNNSNSRDQGDFLSSRSYLFQSLGAFSISHPIPF